MYDLCICVDSRPKYCNIVERFKVYSFIKLSQVVCILNCLLSLAQFVYMYKKNVSIVTLIVCCA